MNLKNIEVLSECRDEKEIKEVLKSFGLDIASEKFIEFKENLPKEEKSEILSYNQLDIVAGGAIFEAIPNGESFRFNLINTGQRVGNSVTFVVYGKEIPFQPGRLTCVLSQNARGALDQCKIADDMSKISEDSAFRLYTGIRNY